MKHGTMDGMLVSNTISVLFVRWKMTMFLSFICFYTLIVPSPGGQICVSISYPQSHYYCWQSHNHAEHTWVLRAPYRIGHAHWSFLRNSDIIITIDESRWLDFFLSCIIYLQNLMLLLQNSCFPIIQQQVGEDSFSIVIWLQIFKWKYTKNFINSNSLVL